MASNGYYGVDNNADLDPSLINRETRPFRYRVHSMVADNGGFLMFILGIMIIAMPYMDKAFVSDILFIFGLFFVWYARGKVRKYQFRKPLEKDKNGKMISEGIMFVGNDRVDGSGIWFSNDDLRTHMLVFGSTGSGKTRFLLGLLYQSLIVGSGCMYVDGKGDNTVWWLLYSLCRRLGREDDLLVINYLTGGDSSADNKRALDRKSNTNNPFAHGSGEQLRSLIVGLMRDSGGDGDMWKGRTSAMLGGVLKALTSDRDRNGVNMDIELIRSYMPLDQIIELASRDDIPESARAPINKYLLELPGYSPDDAALKQLQPKVYEQHGFLIMQLTEVMADMTDTYGHIFAAPLGEVDFKDVVFNRRILFVMLPALEKDPDALSGLGKLVVAGVRSALAPALGDKIEGTKRDVIDLKPTGSDVPFLMILDEYGYYSVKGFAVVAAQARSLGVGVVFAGQDYPSFKKGSEEEAASTVANTNIKICMKLEDPKDTFEIMEARAGESDVALTSGHENKGSAFSGYKDQQQTRLEKRKRINVRDLVRQAPGEAHVIFGDQLSRCRVFYADPHQVNEAKVNKFIMVNQAKKNLIDTINGSFDKLNNLFENQDKNKEEEDIFDEGLISLFSDMHIASNHEEDLLNSSIIAIGMLEVRERITDKELEDKSGITRENENKRHEEELAAKRLKEEERAKRRSSSTKSEDPELPIMPGFPELPDEESETSEEEDLSDNVELSAIDDAQKPDKTVMNQANEFSASFEDILNASIISQIENNSSEPASYDKKSSAIAVNQLAQLEMLRGATEEIAKKEARKGINVLSERGTYPHEPVPNKETQEKLEERVKRLLSNVK